MPDHVPIFEIFGGRVDEPNGVKWLESVKGLASANRRMHEIAAREPGPYFVFYTGNRAVVAHVDTTSRAGNKAGAA